MIKKYRAVILGDTQRGAFGHWLDLAFTRVPEVELIAIAVVAPRWCDQRNPMILACVEADVKGIYLEKPITQTLAHADQFLEACDRKGVKIAVDHWRAGGEVRLARAMIERGEIGRVQTIRGHGKADERSGGVDLMVLGTHVLDAMRYVAGAEVRWVHGHVSKNSRDVTRADVFEGPDGIGLTAGSSLTAQFSFANGVIGWFESIPIGKPQAELKFPPGTHYLGIKVQGTEGILSLRYRSLHRYPRGLWMAGDEFGHWEKVRVPPWDELDVQTYYLHCHEFCVRACVGSIAPASSSPTQGEASEY